MRADVHTESGVRQVLDRLFEALREKDIDKAMSCFAREEDVVMFGLNQREIYRGPAKLKAGLMFNELANADELKISFNWINISSEGGLAWVSAAVQFNLQGNGETQKILARMSVVLGKLMGQWQISQLHLSQPVCK